jgi:hypothetical protein
MKTILHLCADTGSDSKPYKDAGYNVILVGSDIGVENYQPPKEVYGIFANPVCTEFSTVRSGGKAHNPDKGMFLVKECQRIITECKSNGGLQFWVIENPATGALREYLGKPDYIYQPWWLGSPWTKKTSLWGKFNIPKQTYYQWEDVPKLDDLYVRPNRPKPSLAFMHKSAYDLIPEFQHLPRPISDMEFRSLCSQKFAQAFYETNQ